MGQETACTIDYQGKETNARALLEADEIIVRGALRLKIPFLSIERMEATDGALRVTFGGETAVFHLGSAAVRWEEIIRNPKPLMDKLGVKPAMRVAVAGDAGADFLSELAEREVLRVPADPGAESDLLFLFADESRELPAIRALIEAIRRNGALWVVYPKGQKEITEVGVIDAGREAGLKDVKVVRFSATHTALKFVIPVADR
jgi:hypothetical protein